MFRISTKTMVSPLKRKNFVIAELKALQIKKKYKKTINFKIQIFIMDLYDDQIFFFYLFSNINKIKTYL